MPRTVTQTADNGDKRDPSLFHLAELDKHDYSIKGDVHDFEKLHKVFDVRIGARDD